MVQEREPSFALKICWGELRSRDAADTVIWKIHRWGKQPITRNSLPHSHKFQIILSISLTLTRFCFFNFIGLYNTCIINWNYQVHLNVTFQQFIPSCSDQGNQYSSLHLTQTVASRKSHADMNMCNITYTLGALCASQLALVTMVLTFEGAAFYYNDKKITFGSGWGTLYGSHAYYG